jgi:translation initiation factor RLI1
MLRPQGTPAPHPPGFVPTENLRFREESLTFKARRGGRGAFIGEAGRFHWGLALF